MKILVILSSPHKKGSSNLLADNFIRGAREAGHEVSVFDVAHGDFSPCMGCDYCGMPSMTARTEFPKKAYELGKSL